MELQQYLQLLRRWWWLLIIAAFVTGGIAFVLGRSQDPVYSAQVKVFIGGFLQDPNPGSTEIRTGADLATTYASLVTVRPTLEATIQALALDISPGNLAGRITTSTVPQTSILTITVTDNSPVLAASIANELANQLILNSPTNLTPEQEDQRTLIQSEIIALGTQIGTSRTELNALNLELENTTNPEELDRLNTQRRLLISQISEWQGIVADLSTSLSSFGTQTNTLRVVESAQVPSSPINAGVLRNTIVAALVGVALAGGVALLMEYLDNTFRTPEDVQAMLDLPVLAGIPMFGNKKDSYKDKLISVTAPNSTPVEGYRALRTSLIYRHGDQSNNRFIVTSPHMSEGKSVTSANLAVALARSEHKTVLIDADLHRPQVHNFFELENKIGLSNIFNTKLKPDMLFSREELNMLVQPTKIPKLGVITSGPLPSSPAELFNLYHIHNLCHSLEQNLDVEIIIFDTPPILAVTDGMALASNLKADVVLVIAAGKTKQESALAVVQQLNQVGVKVNGVVLNQVSAKSGQYYYYYSYGNYRNQEKTS